MSRRIVPLRASACRLSQSRGLALPMVMMFLVIILLTAVVSIRRTTVTEGITRNQLDYEVARQSAEAALRDAQRDVMLPRLTTPPTNAICLRSDRRMPDTVTPATFASDCPRGQCRLDPTVYASADWSARTNPLPWWPTVPSNAAASGQWGNNANLGAASCSSFHGGVPIGTFTGTPQVRGVARQPEYLIEYFERFSATQRFVRLTARGFGSDPNTEVVLQSYLRFPDFGT